MNTISKVWNYLNGNKTAIGMLLLLAAQGSQAFFPNLMTAEQINFLELTGSIIGGVGIVHKGAKSKAGQDLLTKIKPKKN